ncbi:hypothetical protein [Defluviimonas salinarum]|uniref:Uncharacterized protein n=1 Tax=Defluviimonas salinarum TaxID=2992147 RepID=A0ABT3IXC1_9RHOB|nr:hypothetical protein [Defluviimonas salinarum]MCW3780074.1 hypothetical protein [Defluviimonas salinarum]
MQDRLRRKMDSGRKLSRAVLLAGAATAGVYMASGAASGVGICLRGGPLFPHKSVLLDRAIEGLFPTTFSPAFKDDARELRGPESEIGSFPHVVQYRTAFPDCCGIISEGRIPDEIYGNTRIGIKQPGLWDKLIGRGRYILYAREAAIDWSAEPPEPVAGNYFALFWIDNCGVKVPVPPDKIVG